MPISSIKEDADEEPSQPAVDPEKPVHDLSVALKLPVQLVQAEHFAVICQ
jgi:hypothetical protein